MNRKLLKPNLKEIGKQVKKEASHKPPPPYKTHAENYYYVKQMNYKIPLIVALLSGEILKGRLEWYDEKCLKIKSQEGNSLIVFKHSIKYMQKDPEFQPEEESSANSKETED